MKTKRVAYAMVAVVVAATGYVVTLTTSSAGAATQTLAATGAVQTFTVPAGVTSITFDLFGAAGGRSSDGGAGGAAGGRGGRATATIAVTPGETLTINVGGVGQTSGAGGTGGFNGGGQGSTFTAGGSAGGGGATDVRRGTTSLLVAGGGGGGGVSTAVGGDGGGASGTAGSNDPAVTGGRGGGGGTQAAGGAFGALGGAGGAGQAGSSGQGGKGGDLGGGGGGGGFFGGGGGGGGTGTAGGGGGGGSGFGPGGTTFQSGVQAGDGQAALTFTPVVTPSVDLAISATAPSSASSAPGSQFPVNVHVVNQGPNPSTQGTIVVTSTLPPGVVLASGTGGGFGCTTSGQTLTCSRATPLAPGATADLALVLTVTDPNLTAASITFQVTDPGATDPATANNTTTITVTLRPGDTSGSANPFGNAGGFFGFNPNDIVRQCLASCSVENNRQESSQTVTQAGAPLTQRDIDRAQRDLDRAEDRGNAKADPASGALAASGTRAQAAAASGASPTSSSRIPFTGSNTRHQLFLALLTIAVGWLLASMAPRKQVRRFLHSRS